MQNATQRKGKKKKEEWGGRDVGEEMQRIQ